MTAEIRYSLYRKPTAVSVPLHWSSAHNPSIHTAWPISEINRIFNLCDSIDVFYQQKARMISRWRFFGMHPQILEAVMSHDPTWRRLVARPAPVLDKKVVRFVLDFHPAMFSTSIAKHLKELCTTWHETLLEVWPQFGGIQVSWKRVLPPLWLCLEKRKF